MPDYYKILNIQNGATPEDIKQAYRKLAHKYHPDVSNLPDARELFIELNEAYEYLLNKLKLEQELQKRKTMAYEDTAQSVIDEWLKAERERIRARANRHASMRYSNFKKTKFYRTTVILNNSLYIGTLLLGISVFFGAVLGTWRQFIINYQDVDSNYVASAILVGILGILMTSYSIYKILMSLKVKKVL